MNRSSLDAPERDFELPKVKSQIFRHGKQHKHILGERTLSKLNQGIFIQYLGLNTEMPCQGAPSTELSVSSRKTQLESS